MSLSPEKNASALHKSLLYDPERGKKTLNGHYYSEMSTFTDLAFFIYFYGRVFKAPSSFGRVNTPDELPTPSSHRMTSQETLPSQPSATRTESTRCQTTQHGLREEMQVWSQTHFNLLSVGRWIQPHQITRSSAPMNTVHSTHLPMSALVPGIVRGTGCCAGQKLSSWKQYTF